MNPEASIVCADCGITYVMPDQEYTRFKELAATIPNFVMPRRCAACRKVRRLQQQAAKGPMSMPAVQGYSQSVMSGASPVSPLTVPSPVPTSVLPTPPARIETEPKVEDPKASEVLFVLATKDFDDLVHGRSVVWRGVRVVLADIGFDLMRKVIEDAEIERAKKLIKTNGH